MGERLRIRKKKTVRGLAFAFFFCLLLSSCQQSQQPSSSSSSKEETSSIASTSSASDSSEPVPTFSVLLLKDDSSFEILSENPLNVSRGGEAVFHLKMKSGRFFQSLERNGSEIPSKVTYLSGNEVKLIVEDIRYSQTLKANCFTSNGLIRYHPNGGDYLDGRDSSLPFLVGHELKHRLRPNTEIGTDSLIREGYLLSCWNTKEDGSGEDIGLGSRATVPYGGSLDLYAKWEKESDASEFEYSIENEQVSINRFLGGEKAVVPAKIEGFPVTKIAAGAFLGEEKEVFLPSSVALVENEAFLSSSIQQLTFFDNLIQISDACFSSCHSFKTVHINAILPPRFHQGNLYSEITLADKMDILILNKDKKKLIVFGGSGAYMSVDANQMTEQLSNGMICLNLAVNGWFNAIAQIEMMLPYLREGDVFLHAPEPSSPMGILCFDTMIPQVRDFQYNKTRLYSCVESNYDLFSLVDLRDVSDFFDGFSLYNEGRQGMEASSYTNFQDSLFSYGVEYHNDLIYIDQTGSFALERKANANPEESGEADAVIEYLTDSETTRRIDYFRSLFQSKGAELFFTFAPTNRDTLALRLSNPELFTGANEGNYLYYARPEGIPDPVFYDVDEWIETYDRASLNCFGDDLILPLSQTLYHSGDYCEPDYHLSDEGVVIYTDSLVQALKTRI